MTQARTPNCRVISLLNMKGGVGKTTLAVNLAWTLYEHGRERVLLVDLDPQFNATQYVMDYNEFDDHRRTAGTIADLLLEHPTVTIRRKEQTPKDPSEVLYTIKHTKRATFDLMPAELNLAWVVKNPHQMDYRLEKMLSKLRPKYDYILIDCAPTDSVLTTMALMASDYLLVPIRPDRFSVLGFFNLLQTIDFFRENCHDPHQVKDLGVVFTQVRNVSGVESDCMDEIRAIASKRNSYVFTEMLEFSESYIRSIEQQTPIFRTMYAQWKSRSSPPRIVREMEERIAGIEEGQEK